MKAMRRLAVLGVLAWCFGTAQAQDDDLLVRGDYLMNGVVACVNCHAARDEKGKVLKNLGLSGGMVFEAPVFTAYAANITPDRKTGIGGWTDAQLANAIRNGVRPDGSLIGPPMPTPFYRNLSDRDLAAIIAYLRAQPAVEHAVPKSTYRMPLPPNYGPPVTHVTAPKPTDTVGYGRYLAEIGHCMECHTPRDAHGQLVMSQLGAGGQLIQGPAGMEAVSANLTPDRDGLRNWTDAQVARAIRTGIDDEGKPLVRIMAFDWYRNIDDADMKSLIAYLRSLPAQPSPKQP
ncbi:c-type cytochrome [Castellaniella sp. MT123]|uniref:c-type cytochrome n=1 Tax=Castellaniella sp. MT123 TaxID=3140381 RepID=UPI0031F3FC9E